MQWQNKPQSCRAKWWESTVWQQPGTGCRGAHPSLLWGLPMEPGADGAGSALAALQAQPGGQFQLDRSLWDGDSSVPGQGCSLPMLWCSKKLGHPAGVGGGRGHWHSVIGTRLPSASSPPNRHKVTYAPLWRPERMRGSLWQSPLSGKGWAGLCCGHRDGGVWQGAAAAAPPGVRPFSIGPHCPHQPMPQAAPGAGLAGSCWRPSVFQLVRAHHSSWAGSACSSTCPSSHQLAGAVGADSRSTCCSSPAVPRPPAEGLGVKTGARVAWGHQGAPSLPFTEISNDSLSTPSLEKYLMFPDWTTSICLCKPTFCPTCFQNSIPCEFQVPKLTADGEVPWVSAQSDASHRHWQLLQRPEDGSSLWVVYRQQSC